VLGSSSGGVTKCIAFTLEEDVMHLLGKDVDDLNVSDSDSFEGCPKAPVAADFQRNTDDTSSLV
jgi:hypothetical protein